MFLLTDSTSRCSYPRMMNSQDVSPHSQLPLLTVKTESHSLLHIDQKKRKEKTLHIVWQYVFLTFYKAKEKRMNLFKVLWFCGFTVLRSCRPQGHRQLYSPLPGGSTHAGRSLHYRADLPSSSIAFVTSSLYDLIRFFFFFLIF